MNLYRVEFTINDDYRPKCEGIREISIIVRASDQFTALSIAWEKLSSLGLPEPKGFTAKRIDAE